MIITFASASNVAASGALCTVSQPNNAQAYFDASWMVVTGAGVSAGAILFQLLGGDGTWRSIQAAAQPIAGGGTVAASTAYSGQMRLGPCHGVQLVITGLAGGSVAFAELGVTSEWVRSQ